MKKIIILTSIGGGGNFSVSNSLNQYLNGNYEVKEVLAFPYILQSLKPSFIFSRIGGEEIYNILIRRKWYFIANIFYSLGEQFFRLFSHFTRNCFDKYFQKEQPDLVISVIPIINQDIFWVTKKLHIPFLLVPTDLDASVFFYRLHNTEVHPNFKLALPFDDDEIINMATSYGICHDQISITGFPLRSTFFQDKNKEQIRTQFSIPDYKPNILLLMGKQGSYDMYRFVNELATLDVPIHLICCIGKNESVGKLLKKILLPEHISLSIIGFTQQIADLMSIADLIITKSGSVSVCETIYSNIPTLLDATSTVLQWERFNHHFFRKHQIGGVIETKRPIATQVRKILNNKKLLEKFRNNLLTYDKKQPMKNIPELITDMLNYKPEMQEEAAQIKLSNIR